MTQHNNCFSISDIYGYLKPKGRNRVRYQTYFNMFLNILLDMFEWEGLPESIPARFLEMILHSKGEVFIGRETEDAPLVAAIGSLSGDIDDYCLGTECVAVTPRQSLEGKRNIDIAYGVNNKTATADTLLYWLSHMLAENDRSMELVSTYARLLPIPKVRDEKDKQMFDELIDKLIDGDPKSFASRNALSEALGDNATNILNITDPEQTDKLQYLSRFADDIIKRFYNFYGQPLQTQNKAAQSISDELHGMDSVSFILPLQMLQCRQALADNINKIFGLEVSVRFSQPWEIEYRKYVSNDNDADGTPDAAETKEPNEDPEQTEQSEQSEQPEQSEQTEQTEQADVPAEQTEQTELTEQEEQEDLYRESDESITEDEEETSNIEETEKEGEDDVTED